MPSQASKITDRGYVGKFQKIWFCVSGHAESLVLFTLASSHIYDFACPCKINHWFRLPWQAPEFVILLASMGKIIEFTFICKLQRILFPGTIGKLQHRQLCLPMQSRITDFTYLGNLPNLWLRMLSSFFQAKENHWCCFPWQASTSIFFLARASKIIFWFTLVSYRIGDCACQGKRNHWFCLLWQAPTFTIALVGASQIIDCCWPWRAPTSSFACQGNEN